ncbi:MAG TPA: 2-hydroxyacid dehydrogenase [Candidatus Atribacteria bacterium]|nr:2-hydroxyacid dehydrogenase [Candidatus Atribacteria bacterium]
MKNIVVTFNPQKEGKEILSQELGGSFPIFYLQEENDRKKILEEANVLISWNPKIELKDEEYQFLTRVEIMQLISAGVDHVPFSSLPENLIVLGNVGAYAQPMAEHTVALILALTKRLFIEYQKLREGIFDQESQNRMLKGLTCGILGLGGIGKAVAQLLRAFGVKIVALNTSGKTDEQIEFIGTLRDLDKVLKESDIIVIALPLTRKTRNLIGERELHLMKENAILINVSRGEIVEERALYEHLKGHPHFMAGIDAWWSEPFRQGKFEVHYPFWDLSNFIGSPHNSGVVEGAMEEAMKYAASNVKNYLDGKKVRGVINREDYI